MMDLKQFNVEPLSSQEIIEIEGGKNIVEYIAYGIGYIAGMIESSEPYEGGAPHPYLIAY